MGNKNKTEPKTKFLQLNCNRRHDINVIIEKELANNEFDIALLQEPSFSKKDGLIHINKLLHGGIFYNFSSDSDGPRTAILINKNFRNNALKIHQLSDEHMTTIRMKIDNVNYLVCSFYAHHSKSAQDLQDRLDSISEFARQENLIIILGGDFNAKHSAWNSDYDDAKGKIIIDAICENKWNLLNSNEKTFHRKNGYRSTVEDKITLIIVCIRSTSYCVSQSTKSAAKFAMRTATQSSISSGLCIRSLMKFRRIGLFAINS